MTRLMIRQGTYRRRPGFLIYGKDTLDRSVSIFTETRESAETIRNKVKEGKTIELADFEGCCKMQRELDITKEPSAEKDE